MKNLIFILSMILLISACENHSRSGSLNSDNNNNQGQKKVQPGDSLTFNCPDSFHKTIVKVTASWVGNTSEWSVSVNEQDAVGNQVLRIDNLVGDPDKTEVLYMNISNGSELYARVSQIGVDQALYNDGKRNLVCTFN